MGLAKRVIWNPFLISVIMEMFVFFFFFFCLFGSLWRYSARKICQIMLSAVYKGAVFSVCFQLYFVKPQVFMKCLLGFLGKLGMWSRWHSLLPLGPVVNNWRGSQRQKGSLSQKGRKPLPKVIHADGVACCEGLFMTVDGLPYGPSASMVLTPFLLPSFSGWHQHSHGSFIS